MTNGRRSGKGSLVVGMNPGYLSTCLYPGVPLCCVGFPSSLVLLALVFITYIAYLNNNK